MLAKLLDSAARQTRPYDQIVVRMDYQHVGAPSNLARAFADVDTDWVTCMGDDDWLYPEHVEKCLAWALEHDADYVYPGYDVIGGTNPFEYWFGKPYDPEMLLRGSCIPGGGSLMRVAKIREVGGIPVPGADDFHAWDDEWPDATHEDHALNLRMLHGGAKFTHLPERLWAWYHHGENTSGRGDRWGQPTAAPYSGPLATIHVHQ
jgi:hypothetical protein